MGVLGLDGMSGSERAEVCKGEIGGRSGGRCSKIEETEKKGISYGNFGNCMFSEMDAISAVSPSVTMSWKWYWRASLSVVNWVTRSVRSMVSEAKPLASR